MFRTTSLFLVAATALVGAVHVQPTPPSYRVSEAPAGLRSAIQRGDMVIITLQNAVLSELSRELNRRGPAGAMTFCHLDVAGAAVRAAREDGVTVGRTSARLRSPTNAPRPWAAPFVARHASGTVEGIDGYVVDLGDRVGLLRPIAHRASCDGCHGPADRMSAGVRAHLEERYPQDRAVGFRTGDLRGWFWVEVPRP